MTQLATFPALHPNPAVYHGADTKHPARAHQRGTPGQNEANPMDIADWRNKIDELDEQIVHLISQRAAAAKAIGELKAASGLPVYEPTREQAVFAHVLATNPGPLADAEMLHVYERIIDVMRTLQRPQA